MKTFLAVESTFTAIRFWLLWVLASAIGLGLGFGVSRVAVAMVAGEAVGGAGGSAAFGPQGNLVAWVVAGMVGGSLQWLVLRRYVPWAGWWVLVAALGVPSLGALNGVLLRVVPAVMDGVEHGAVLGVVTGVILLWPLRQGAVGSIRN